MNDNAVMFSTALYCILVDKSFKMDIKLKRLGTIKICWEKL